MAALSEKYIIRNCQNKKRIYYYIENADPLTSNPKIASVCNP